MKTDMMLILRSMYGMILLFYLVIFICGSVFYKILPGIFFVMVLYMGFENLFNNIFGRSDSEILSYFLLPVDIKQIIFAKNLNIIILAGLMFIPMMTGFYIFWDITGSYIFNILCYFLSTIFLLVASGNLISVFIPPGKHHKDRLSFSYLFLSGMTLMVISIPYFIVNILFDNNLYFIPLYIITGMCWYLFSLNFTAKLIQNRKAKIVGTE